MNLLHLDSSITGPQSVSRLLSSAIVDRLKGTHADLRVTYRDLAHTPISHLSPDALAAAFNPAAVPEPAVQSELALGSNILEEFLAADVVVIGVGFYNFSISSQLKAWIDRIVIRGKTFQYGEKGPQGLAGGKRVILAVARGGYYGPGSPVQAFEHAETYLRAVFGFVGVTHLEVVEANGLATGADQRDAAVKAALQQVAALPAAA